MPTKFDIDPSKLVVNFHAERPSSSCAINVTGHPLDIASFVIPKAVEEGYAINPLHKPAFALNSEDKTYRDTMHRDAVVKQLRDAGFNVRAATNKVMFTLETPSQTASLLEYLGFPEDVVARTNESLNTALERGRAFMAHIEELNGQAALRVEDRHGDQAAPAPELHHQNHQGDLTMSDGPIFTGPQPKPTYSFDMFDSFLDQGIPQAEAIVLMQEFIRDKRQAEEERRLAEQNKHHTWRDDVPQVEDHPSAPVYRFTVMNRLLERGVPQDVAIPLSKQLMETFGNKTAGELDAQLETQLNALNVPHAGIAHS